MINTVWKKIALILTIALISIMLIPGLTAVAADSIAIYVDGAKVNFPDVQPELISGRTMIPIRHFFNALGYTVDYTSDSAPIHIYNSTQRLTLTLNSDIYTYNGKEGKYRLDVPAQKVDGRALAPLRFPLQELGYEVDGSVKGVVYVTKSSSGTSNKINTEESDNVAPNSKSEKVNAMGFKKEYTGKQFRKAFIKAELSKATGINENGEAAYLFLGADYNGNVIDIGFEKEQYSDNWFIFCNFYSAREKDKEAVKRAFEDKGAKSEFGGGPSNVWSTFSSKSVPDGTTIEMDLSEQNNGLLKFRAKIVGEDNYLIDIDIPFGSGITKAGGKVDYRTVASYFAYMYNGAYDGGMSVKILDMKLYDTNNAYDWTDKISKGWTESNKIAWNMPGDCKNDATAKQENYNSTGATIRFGK